MPQYWMVLTDNWGHNPGYTKGQIIQVDGDADDPLPGHDVAWAAANGVIVEVDEHGRRLDAEDAPAPIVIVGRLPVGNEQALDKGPSTGGAVTNPGTDSPEAAAGETADPDEDLTPAQKAARTRAANAANNA